MRSPHVVAWLVLPLLAAAALAQPESVKMVSDVGISPDGSRIAVSWRGDIWTADSVGGDLKRLTSHSASDRNPRWSPDGRKIGFVSSRNGGRQIWVIDAWGGAPEQITTNTNGFDLLEWTEGGDGFLVSGSRDHWWRDAARFFIRSLETNESEKLLFDAYGDAGTMSPDGKHLLFTREGTRKFRKGYTGAQESQVWVWSQATGAFRMLHSGEGGSRWPMWGGDSDTYFYVGRDSGTWNLYRCKLSDGSRTQVTKFKDDGVMFPAISRDGSTIVFTKLFALHRMDTKSGEIEAVNLEWSGEPTLPTMRRIQQTTATEAAFTGDAREMAFVADGDLYVMDTELREPVAVIESADAESNPVWSKDMETLYFISDSNGQTDIWKATKSDTEKWWWQNESFKLTQVTDDPAVESGLRMWHDGEKLSFHHGSNVVSMDIKSGERQTILESWNMPNYDFSPDGKWITYSVQDDDYNHDVWIKPLDGSHEPFNLSCHPDNDRSPVWSPDGTMIAFTGRRWGNETDIVYVNLVKEKDEETARKRRLEKAITKMKARKKGKKGAKSEKPASAGSGKKAAASDPVSGLWKGRIRGSGPIPAGGLVVRFQLEIDKNGTITGTMKSLLGEGEIVQGTYDFNTGKVDILVDAGGQEVTVTGSLKDDEGSGTWDVGVANGTWKVSRTEPATGPDFASTSAVDSGEKVASTKAKKKRDGKKAKVEVKVDFEGLRDRLRRIRNSNSSERGLRWAAKGKTLYFTATVGGKSGTHSVTFPDKTRPKAEKVSFTGMGSWLDDGKTLGGISSGKPATTTSSGKTSTFAFTVRKEVDVAKRHTAIFDEAWRIMRDRFYDERLGNNDWNAIRSKYRPMAEQALDSGTLSNVVNMMLGELNGSHLGFSMRGGRPGAPSVDQWRMSTGHFGARYDMSFAGPGLKVKDVIEGTPAYREDSRLRPGDIILSIDGMPVSASLNLAKAMTVPPAHIFQLEVVDSEGKNRNVQITATSAASVRGRLYEKWIQDNRAAVDKLSNGTLGYLHIRAMSGGNLLRFDAELYRVGHGKDGLVIDVRENGGGSITDHLLTCLCQPTHAITRARGGSTGYPHDRRIYATWNKPIIVLCNQNSFSNAEIFSHAIKTLNRGKVVGVPTAGGVISTGGASVMGAAFIRTPFRGWYLMDGEDMELNGCVPNHVIWPAPGEIPSGKDRQLEKAISVLMSDVKEWKSRPMPKLRKATERTRR